MNYRGAKQYIIERMSRELSGHLAYHGLHHTLDVLAMSVELCESEGVSAHDTVLVKTAALYHDCGFVKNKHAGHEQEGCLIVRAQLPDFAYSEADIETICGMIMATKIPQSPKTLLEEIICDADLDYLGRSDFFKIGETLFHELHAYHLIDNEQAWNRLQVSFLSAHHYHTQTNIRRREPAKQEYLQALKGLVATYEV